MTLTSELLENIIAVLPGAIALLLILRVPKKIYGWAIWVLGSSILGIIALGFLLKRLTAGCPMPVPQCAPDQIVLKRIPGIISKCYDCASSPTGDLVAKLNEIALPIQAISAVICVLISFYTVMRFVFWARGVLKT